MSHLSLCSFFLFKLEQFLADSDTAKQVLRQHILIGEWTLDQLADENEICTLQGICATMQAKRVSE